MSGIAALVMRAGAPADPALLRRLADGLAYRSPDGVAQWRQDEAGLVHGLLRVGDVHEARSAGAVTLGDGVWISADARLDGRAGLLAELRAAGEAAPAEASAAQLILHAWRAWGSDCPARLLGDFAFCLWDAPRRRLFCARDAMGGKPLWYAPAADFLAVANTLDALRLPGVDDELDEEAIAEVLVHGAVLDPRLSIRRGIRGVPPGHSLSWEHGTLGVRRWWRMPEDEPLRLRGPQAYAERFVELMSEAVRDRLPQGNASILLSGGHDSPTVAALARAAVERGERDTRLHGFTAFHARLMPDDEPRYAGMVAEALGIPVTWQELDGYRLYQGVGSDPLLYRPEPGDGSLRAAESEQQRQAAAHGRVLLTGSGGDPLLKETPSRLTRLLLSGHPLRALGEGAEYLRWHRRFPRPGVRSWLRAREPRGVRPVSAPPWIQSGFARRVDLPGRLAEQNALPQRRHPLRPLTWEQLRSPFWGRVSLEGDPGNTRLHQEIRHPFLDLRLIRFVLSVPPAQWYNDKGLIRIGMRGRLPAPVLRRGKTPLRGDPYQLRRERDGEGWLGGGSLDARMREWVELDRLPRSAGGRGSQEAGDIIQALAPWSISRWLDTARESVSG